MKIAIQVIKTYEVETDGGDPQHPGCYLGGKIVSDMKGEDDEDIEGGSEEDTARDQCNAAVDALESIILTHACAGINIALPAYIEGIETAAMKCCYIY